jgi:hypothetical protein
MRITFLLGNFYLNPFPLKIISSLYLKRSMKEDKKSISINDQGLAQGQKE